MSPQPKGVAAVSNVRDHFLEETGTFQQGKRQKMKREHDVLYPECGHSRKVTQSELMREPGRSAGRWLGVAVKSCLGLWTASSLEENIWQSVNFIG